MFAGLMSPRSGAVGNKEGAGSDWDDGLIFNKSKAALLPEMETNSKSDFLRQMDLMTVDQSQVTIRCVRICNCVVAGCKIKQYIFIFKRTRLFAMF
jgi:hypothetical protein